MKESFLEIHLNSSTGKIARSFLIKKSLLIFLSILLVVVFSFMSICTIYLTFNLVSLDILSKSDIKEYLESNEDTNSTVNYNNFTSPLNSKHYYISKIFDDDYHQGIDIISKKGSKVFSSETGRVLYSGIDKVYGKIIILSHKDNFYSFYGHLDTSFVMRHEIVGKNQIIGLVGETGNTSGPHLHFEIWNKYDVKNPLEVVDDLKIKNLIKWIIGGVNDKK